jgi:hypothetical protein
MSASVAAINIASLRSMPSMSARTLEGRQLHHPDHRSTSEEGRPFPCPSNGIMRAYQDIDFRDTKIKDLPKGLVARKKSNQARRQGKSLGKSKWDFAYMKSGNSLAVPVQVREDHEDFNKECHRIRAIGLRMCAYQKSKGYIEEGFEVQTSIEQVIIRRLGNGTPVTQPHVVFWRIDGTHLESTSE